VGQFEQFIGVAAPYERPSHPELTLDSTKMSAEETAERLLDLA
jgi:adenylylsulfate kinase